MVKKSLVLLLALAVVGFGAFVTSAVAQQQVNVTFWHAMSKYHQGTLKALANEFMQANPNIKITLVYQAGYGTLSQKLISAVMAGNPPVMAQMYEDDTAKYIQADALMPLGPVMPASIINDLPESMIADNTYVVNGKNVLMTVPFNKSAMILFYNTDLVKNPPTTWDELLQTAKSLTKNGNYGFGIRPYPEFFIEFLHQAGGQVLSPDKKKCLINSAAGIKAMQYLLSLKPYSLYQTSYLSGPFGAGKVAMYIGSSAGMPFVAGACKGHHGWMTAPLPAGPANDDSIIQGTNLGVFTVGTTQAQRDAAVKFIEFLLSKAATLQWAEETGYLPVLKSAINSDEWQTFLKDHPEDKAGAQMILKGFTSPHHPNWYNIRQEIGTAFEQVMLGKATPKAALDNAAQTIESKYLK